MTRCPTCGGECPADALFCSRDGTRLPGLTSGSPGAGGRAGGASRRASSTRDARLEPGSCLDGRYEVERKIGEGGMSFVYLARDNATGDRHAVKVLSASMSSDVRAMERLRREAGFGMRLAHPNVCHILRTGETESGLVYVVMPYIPGEVLSDRMHSVGQLPLSDVTGLVRDIAAGLQVAHALGIVHRDLKPENIIVSRRPDGSEFAVVMDFGLAKEGRADTDLLQLTATGTVVGTPEFMSPEQIRGKTLDARSDVYALALMTYEMLTGRLPFEGATAQQVMTARLRGAPLPLRQARPDLDLPEGVERVIARGLQRSPDLRHRTAPKFAEALAAAGERAAVGHGEGWLGRWFRR